MTLQEVARSERKKVPLRLTRILQGEGFDIIASFEADPDFKLRERVEAMVADLERPYNGYNAEITPKGIARRLREVLDP